MNLPAFFLELVDLSISAGWLVLAILLLRFVIRKAPKWMTCALWALVAIRLILPFSLESNFSLIPPSSGIDQTIEAVSDTYVGDTYIFQDGTREYEAAVDAGRQPVPTDNGHYYVVTAPDGISEPATVQNTLIPLLSTVWLAGIALLLIYASISYLRLRRRVAASIHMRENIYLCDYIESPFILGVLKPRIYLPSSLEQNNWPHVLAHERAHLKRRDHWWKPLGFVLLCIHWFNPLLWLAYILLCRDIELACDEKVIKVLGDSGKAAYSEALLECSMPRYLIAACPLAFGEVGVKDRVKSILNYRKPAFWMILAAMVLCIAVAVCFLTDPVSEPAYEFTGTVKGVYQAYISVEPHPDSNEAKSAGLIDVVLPEDAPHIQSGDTVRIEYDGQIQESYPARIPNVSKIEVLNDLEYVSRNYDLTRAILENYVVMVDGDAVAGQEFMHNFYQKVQKGAPASIRYVKYHTIGDPDRIGDELFESSRESYPMIFFHELTYDGETFTVRWFEGDTEYVQEWKYLLCFEEGPPVNADAGYRSFEGYMLTDRDDVTYEMVWNGVYSADFRDQIAFKEVYRDYRYDHEPTLAELEAAKLALEPYMSQYRIASLDANELTGRLDIQVYDWVGGLFGIIEQYIDRDFVTVTELRGTLEFTAYTDIELAVLDGCVTSVNGDIVAGQAQLEAFLSDTAQGHPATLRLASFYYLSSPDNHDPDDLTDCLQQLPSVSQSILVYDGTKYLHHIYDNGHIYTSVYQYLLTYRNVPYGSLPNRNACLLTDREDLSWEEYMSTFAVSYVESPGYPLCSDILHKNEPTLAELEQAKRDLEPHMSRYHIVSLDANELTGRLDIRVTDWVVGLDDLVGQYIDLTFVTIGYGEGSVTAADPTEPAPPSADASLTVVDATASEGLLVYELLAPAGSEIWTGFDYSLEKLTDGGWVHFGIPSQELAWPDALLVHHENTSAQAAPISGAFFNQWSETTGETTLPPGTYRYCKSFTIFQNGEYSHATCYAEFEVPENAPEEPGLHMEVLDPTETGATLAITYHGGLLGELVTEGKYYLMVDVGNGVKKYGLVPSQVAWDDVLYRLEEGQTLYLEVRWSHTTDGPLPAGVYHVMLQYQQELNGADYSYSLDKTLSESFAIVD